MWAVVLPDIFANNGASLYINPKLLSDIGLSDLQRYNRCSKSLADRVGLTLDFVAVLVVIVWLSVCILVGSEWWVVAVVRH